MSIIRRSKTNPAKAGFVFLIDMLMYELFFNYSFDLFGGKPKRDIEKIPECKVSLYSVDNDLVNLTVICDSAETVEKLKQYFSIRYEIFPKKTSKID